LASIVISVPINLVCSKFCKKQVTEKEKKRNMLDDLFTSESEPDNANQKKIKETGQSQFNTIEVVSGIFESGADINSSSSALKH